MGCLLGRSTRHRSQTSRQPDVQHMIGISKQKTLLLVGSMVHLLIQLDHSQVVIGLEGGEEEDKEEHHGNHSSTPKYFYFFS